MGAYAREELVMGNLLREKAKSNKGKPFIGYNDEHLTYDEFNEMVNRSAQGLMSQGVQRGDKVALMLHNSPDFLSLIFALAKLGAVGVPVNTAYKGDLLEHIVTSSDSSMMVVEEEWLPRVAQVETGLAQLQKVVVRANGTSAAPPKGLSKETLNFRTLTDHPATEPDIHVHHGELQALMYTSGTTGPSKGVMVAQAHGPTAALVFIDCVALTSYDVIFSPMPLFHGIGFWQGVLGTMMADASIVISDRFSASAWWNSINKHKATVGLSIFSAVPILMSQEPSENDKSHTMTRFYLGQSSMDQAMYDRFGVHTVEIYGSTEVGICTGTPYGERRPGSCGRAWDAFYEVAILDELDRELPPGEAGEFCIRSKVPYSLTSGYYNFDGATLEAFRNLWFHSGDRGYTDKDGYFYFIDRTKDALRRRGENVSSFEVERVINAHPAVLESAIIAVPSELAEDEIKACVVLQPGASLSPEELLAHCEERMAYFMVPRHVEFIKALPKTPTEKVEKYKLRQEGDRGITPNTWDREKAGYKVKRT